jgi:uncharacterized protein
MKRFLFFVLGLAFIAYVAGVSYIFAIQRQMLFRPDTARVAPASAGLAQAEEVVLKTEGQPDIILWHIPRRTETDVVFVYLHGNGASLPRRSDRFAFLAQQGAGVLAVSWRGYGGSAGSPSETGFREDARRALAWLATRGVSNDRIILLGESLGTGIAVMTASELAGQGKPVKALILDSPYDSIQAIAQARFWWLPVGLLMRDPFRADLAAPQVRSPVLALKCRNDWLTAFPNATRLYDLLGGPKRAVIFERRCHVPPYSAGSGAAIRAFMADLEGGKMIN